MGTGVPSQGVRWPWHEIGHSPPATARVKNMCSCTSTNPVCPHGMDRAISTHWAKPYLTEIQFEENMQSCSYMKLLTQHKETFQVYLQVLGMSSSVNLHISQ